jgi:hypothetical protein
MFKTDVSWETQYNTVLIIQPKQAQQISRLLKMSDEI